MADVQQETLQSDQTQSQIDWNKLAARLGAGSAEEAQRRAYNIAKFVADVENDADSQLILKTGRKQVELTLKR